MSDHSFRANVAGVKGAIMAGGERLPPGSAAWVNLATWHRNGRRLWLLGLFFSLGALWTRISISTQDIHNSFRSSYQPITEFKPWLELAFQCLVPFTLVILSAIFYASRRRSESICRERIATLAEIHPPTAGEGPVRQQGPGVIPGGWDAGK